MFFHLFDCLADIEALDEDVAVNIADTVDTFLRESTTLESQTVHAAILDRVTGSLDEGGYILVNEGTALGDDMRADVNELQTSRLATKDDIVAHDDMTGEGGIVGQHTVVADDTIMSHMDIGHDKVAIAYNSLAAGGGAAVDGAAFADGIVVTNLDSGVFSGELKVLRYGGNDSTGEDATVLTNTGTGEDGYIGAYPSAVAYLHIFTNGSEV